MNLNKYINKIFKPVLFSALLFSTLNSCAMQADKDMEEAKNKRPLIIPYIMKIGNQTDLYLMDLETKSKYRLTEDPYEEADPSILPNGRVLFTSKRTGTWQLYTINFEGAELKPLTSDRGFNNYRPSLAVDGSILFVSDRELKQKIYTMDLDGGSVIKLTDGDNYYDYPSPLDDGTVLFLSNAGTKWEVWKMNADGSNKTRITNLTSNPISLSAMPSYVKDTYLRSPMLDDSFVNRRNSALYNLSAKAIFTSRDKKGDLEIYRINIDGTDLRNLSLMPGIDANPVVLRNGKIIFTSDRDGTFNVWLMDPDGYNPINLTKEPYYASTR